MKPSFVIGPVPSVSKEDALTERLRVLRNASSSSVPSSSAASGSGQASAASPKPGQDTQAEGHGTSQSPLHREQIPVSGNANQRPLKVKDTTTQTQSHILSSAWGLEEVDDQALDELLEGLQDDLNLQEDVPDEAKNEDEDHIDLHAIANNNDGIIENDEERVQKLLAELAPKPNNNSFADDNDDNNSDDENSDGEAMTKETNKILDQVQDEINLNGGPTDLDNNNSNPFSLPSPPSGTRTPTYTSPKSPSSSLNLPAVPTTLSPPPGCSAEEAADPNNITSLTARLSHLRSTPIRTDAFGLPSVPTTTLILPAGSSLPSSSSSSGFPPQPVSTKYQTRSTKGWVGRGETYTDEDVKKWCTVCLEDATIRCEGCEDSEDGGGGEVYCVRCWREMHVGPAAGWEERGHRWFRLNTTKNGGKGTGMGEWSGPTTPM